MPQHIGIVVGGDAYIHASTKQGVVAKNRVCIFDIDKIDSPNPVYMVNPIGIKRATIFSDDPRGFQKPIG